MYLLPFSISCTHKHFLFFYITLCLLIIISCPLMASVLVLTSTGLLFSSALICQLLLIKEMSSFNSKPSGEQGKLISHRRRVEAVSVDEAAMKKQQGSNGSVQTKTSANKRLIKMNVRNLQANRNLCLTDR